MNSQREKHLILHELTLEMRDNRKDQIFQVYLQAHEFSPLIYQCYFGSIFSGHLQGLRQS